MDWWWMITLGLWLTGSAAPATPAAVPVAAQEPAEMPAEAAQDEPQVEVSPELEAMAEAEQDAFAAEAWEAPSRDEHSRWEGMQQPERAVSLHEERLPFELGTGWLQSSCSRPGGAPALASRGAKPRGFGIPVVVNEQVGKLLNFLSVRTKGIFVRWLARTTRYYPIMRPILKKHGLPEDLVAVALIESGLSYSAFSRASASGPWQFIKGTAALYGLRVDFWVDERRDVVKATDAAARLLKDLYTRFGDWYLAWAAYNSGAGTVDRAIQKVGSTDFWELAATKCFRAETKMYVPKILAAALIERDPKQYGFEDIPFLKPLQWDEVQVQGMADLRAAAAAVGISLDEIKELNPELIYWCSPPYLKSYPLRIPKGSSAKFKANYRPTIRDNRTAFARHLIRPGDTLSHLAVAYKTSVDALMAANRITDPRKVGAGRILLVPIQPCGNPVQVVPSAASLARKTPASAPSKESGKEKPAVDDQGRYVIKDGDTLSGIALRHKTTVKAICELNGIGPEDKLKVGTIIKVGP
jgi:membrane-bound lytic murein transglycosylase D